MVELFIRSYKRAPEELILDFDATDNAVHGKQEGRFFHGYYDPYSWGNNVLGSLVQGQEGISTDMREQQVYLSCHCSLLS